MKKVCVTDARIATERTTVAVAQNIGFKQSVENDNRIPLTNKLSPLQMSVNVRPTTKLKWAFCFLGEHFMAATKTDTFMNVTTLPINMVDMDNATEIEKVGV